MGMERNIKFAFMMEHGAGVRSPEEWEQSLKMWRLK